MHTFHIPVLGLSYSVDTPLKVARYGIASVVSIIEDEMVEKMRAYHCLKSGEPYTAITTKADDYRAKRITAYLNLLNKLVQQQLHQLRRMPFEAGNDLVRYFELLPDNDEAKTAYTDMLQLADGEAKKLLQQELRTKIVAGAIDVNIMAKVDNLSFSPDGNPLPAEYSDALSALRGFANSDLQSSVVLSAGYNPRLYSYLEKFNDFYPDKAQRLIKKIILKVSDYRSALIQGKLLAKKGLWVSEFRIESGLNCGGHAFATDGYLMGPILEEFREKRALLASELLELCNKANEAKGNHTFTAMPPLRITVQGGIGTANEDEFLRTYYEVDGTGWGSPFLLVPEATNVDNDTLQQLATASKEDYYLSHASPLGVPFHNFRKSTAEQQRKDRITKGRPGSPCYKKFLSTNTEFTSTPICAASRQYQDLKIKELAERNLPADVYEAEMQRVTEKDCLCEGLSVSALLKGNINVAHKLTAVTICPGPNLAYFSGTFTLPQMVGHIYGREHILNSVPRPNMFINELNIYVDYLKNEIEKCTQMLSQKQESFFNSFRNNLLNGINYYKALLPELKKETEDYIDQMLLQLNNYQETLNTMPIGSKALVAQ
ncbi:MAG: hypothetical protein K9G49_09000 [Taibaiella sp.]|nr:hypothetical protein [Taibaiella sp.]